MDQPNNARICTYVSLRDNPQTPCPMLIPTIRYFAVMHRLECQTREGPNDRLQAGRKSPLLPREITGMQKYHWLCKRLLASVLSSTPAPAVPYYS